MGKGAGEANGGTELLDEEKTMENTDTHEQDRRPDMGVHITIDRKPYVAPRDNMTGAELRKIPDPDIPADRDLWLDIPHGDDDRIDDDEVVHLRNGQKFYTVPKTINPGAGAE